MRSLVLTCEHGGYKIPSEYSRYFRDKELLKSHRGWDPGALEMARVLSTELNVDLYYEEISRLLVEQNRSRFRKEVFSEFTQSFTDEDKEQLLETFYDPYHSKVENTIAKKIKDGMPVMHLSIHTFTPELNGEQRNTDVGLLYDPSRTSEKKSCLLLQSEMHKSIKAIKIRRNYPYAGDSDGFTSHLRKKYDNGSYQGIEIEINQKHYFNQTTVWRDLKVSLPVIVKTSLKLLQ